MNPNPQAFSLYHRRVVRYAEWIVRYRWLVLTLSLLAIAAMTAGARHLKFDTDFRAYFGPENPQLQTFNESQNVYAKNDAIMFVFAPEGRDVFEPRTLAAIRDFTAEAWALPYTMRVDSVTNFQNTQATGDDLAVGPLVPERTQVTPDVAEKAREVALHEPLLLNRLVTPAGHVAVVNVVSQFPQATSNEIPELVAAARALRDRYQEQFPGLRIYMTGSNMMSNAFTEAAKHDMGTLVPAMYGAIFLIMWLMLRSGWAVFSTLLVVFFSSLSAMGLAGYFGISLTPPVVQAPQIIMVLAVADSVHICLTMFALMREGWGKHAAIIESLRVNFTPVFLVSATTSLAFLGTNFTDSPPLTAPP